MRQKTNLYQIFKQIVKGKFLENGFTKLRAFQDLFDLNYMGTIKI